MRGVRPRFPGRPKYGQPSFHVTGDSAVSRPTEFPSIIDQPHHSPAGVCTMPPWCIAMPPRAFGYPKARGGMAMHQGGIVHTPAGEWWGWSMFEGNSVGRLTALSPVTWKDGWPYFGLPGNLGRTPRVWVKPKTTRPSAAPVHRTCAATSSADPRSPMSGSGTTCPTTRSGR